MTVMARFSGTCPECDGRWQPGDLIRAEEDQVWRHACCPGPYDHITVGAVTPERLTAPAEVTRAADDDADRVRSDFTRPPRPVCGCCGPQRCCCPCHQEER